SKLVRVWWAAWLLTLVVCLLGVPSIGSADGVVSGGTSLTIEMLDAAAGDPSIEQLADGTLDSHFRPFDFKTVRQRDAAFWVRLRAEESSTPGTLPTLNVSKGRHLQIQGFTLYGERIVQLRTATHLPGFRGMHQAVLALPDRLSPGQL